MTIIISCLTPEYVVQVSDRRVVWIGSGNRIENIDDNSNKAVNFCHRIAFGYTGLAELEAGIRTDIWIANTLTNLPKQSIESAADTIRIKATECFRRLRHIDPVIRRHAFVGVGWAIPLGEEAFCPLFINISNFHDERGKQLPHAMDEFTVNVDFLHDKDPGAFNVTGRQLTPDIAIDLRRYLRKCAKKKVGALTVISLLAKAIREMASRFHDVGSSLMALSIPKSTLELESPFYLMSAPSGNAHTYIYLPAGQNNEVVYGPNYVCGGNALTRFSYITGEKVKAIAAALDAISPFDYYKAIVVTSWGGSGNQGDSRHPAVADDYILDGYGVISDMPSWPKDQACPYYGCLVGINAVDNTIDDIRKDKRFLIIYSATDKDNTPDQDWIMQLKAWLVSQGMPEIDANSFVADFSTCTRKGIAEKLNALLKISRANS